MLRQFGMSRHFHATLGADEMFEPEHVPVAPEIEVEASPVVPPSVTARLRLFTEFGFEYPINEGVTTRKAARRIMKDDAGSVSRNAIMAGASYANQLNFKAWLSYLVANAKPGKEEERWMINLSAEVATWLNAPTAALNE
jgi:hypothetical protein